MTPPADLPMPRMPGEQPPVPPGPGSDATDPAAFGGPLPEAGAPVADQSVRVAWAADAEAVAAVQARSWTRSYADLLPQDLLNQVDVSAFAQAWSAALTKPPTARHRVLVALQHGDVVGFAATAPSEDPDAEPVDAEVTALHVDPAAQHQGHGSRLLAAIAETLRADGFTRARTWVLTGDDELRAFLEPAGWGPDSAHRTLDLVGDGSAPVRQVRLHTDLTED